MNPVYTIQSDIVEMFNDVINNSRSKEFLDDEITKINIRINGLKLVRDRYAASTLITSLFIKMNIHLCLAYEYNGTLYCTSRKVIGRPSTDFLHTLNLNSSQWNDLPTHHVWISTGKIYSKI